MQPEEVEKEIEKLKVKKLELMTKANLTNDFNEKETFEKEIVGINNQIETLEKLKKKP